MGKEQDTQVGSPKYWLSLEQWRNDPEFAKLAENEFRVILHFQVKTAKTELREGNF